MTVQKIETTAILPRLDGLHRRIPNLDVRRRKACCDDAPAQRRISQGYPANEAEDGGLKRGWRNGKGRGEEFFRVASCLISPTIRSPGWYVPSSTGSASMSVLSARRLSMTMVGGCLAPPAFWCCGLGWSVMVFSMGCLPGACEGIMPSRGAAQSDSLRLAPARFGSFGRSPSADSLPKGQA